jgi:multidrug efflux pump subunit AcrA (membrane-fusion protein)
LDNGSTHLSVAQRIDSSLEVGLELHFDPDVAFARRRPTLELAEVLLDLVTTVYLRNQVTELRQFRWSQSDRDALIQRMSEGVGLADSFYAIADAVADDVDVDRVSLLRQKSSGCQLVATSTQPNVDRRARQVRLIETLANHAIESAESFRFCVGDQANESRELPESLEAYLYESGCREIHVQRINGKEGSDPVAAIVVERFRGRSDDDVRIEDSLKSCQSAIDNAVAAALSRDDAGWGLIFGRLSTRENRRRLAMFAAVASILFLAICLIPTTLKIPVDGRVLASKRSHVFSPVEGIVNEVLVINGQEVKQGQTLFTLRSPGLEMEQRAIEGDLATARTRLAALQALRSRGDSSVSAREASSSASEQVLKAEIEGLEQQSQLLKRQIAALEIKSPIDGKVERWDLEQSLVARPVTHGQYLVDVVSNADGWGLELDVPDAVVNYLLRKHRQTPCEVSFRVRSDPIQVHQGTVSEISEVAHVDARGRSMVRATVQLDESSLSSVSDSFRSGADVLAQVHCGQRSVGFVMFRGIIEWWRSQSWI